MWEDQRISGSERYRELVSALRFVARQEIIFGLHVHVGIDDADKAIHVTNGMRVHIPVLLALSANSPFWRAQATGLASTRMPIFRAFPRTGIPPTYKDWADYESRIGFMVESGAIKDYTFLWYDVRPHPNFGTVEVRAMDAQTRVEHTLGAGGADPGDGQGAGRALRGGRASSPLPVRDARGEPLAGGAPRPRRPARRSPAQAPGVDEGARAPPLRPPAAARAGPRRRARVRRPGGHHRARRRRVRASGWSSRPTTTSTRSCARSSPQHWRSGPPFPSA